MNEHEAVKKVEKSIRIDLFLDEIENGNSKSLNVFLTSESLRFMPSSLVQGCVWRNDWKDAPLSHQVVK